MDKTRLMQQAAEYLRDGICVIVTDENKSAILKWKKYQGEMITEAELREQMEHPGAAGIANVCGAVSGNLEVIDIDLKYAIDPDNFYTRLCEEVGHDILQRLYIVKTRSGGYHWYYRCEMIERNEKLAWRATSDEERKVTPDQKKLCLIETRGEAGYVVAPPTEGYRIENNVPVPLISIDEREALWSAARSMNEYFEDPKPTSVNRTTKSDHSLRPGDDYNKRGNVVSLLQSHGWTVVSENSEKVVFLRPGNTTSKSSGNFNKTKNWFSVFTTNSCFEPEKAYLPYAVYALLEHDGDFKAAAKSLAEQGYGDQRSANNGTQSSSTKGRNKMDEAILAFWTVGKRGEIAIKRHSLHQFLSKNGFYLYRYRETSPKLVRLNEGIIDLVTIDIIKKFVRDYILSLPAEFDGITRGDLMEQILKGQDAYFSKSSFEFMEYTEPEFLQDDKDTAYYPFRNGVVIVDKDGYRIAKYTSIKKCVWKSHIINFDIITDENIDTAKIEFYKFLSNTMANDEPRTLSAMETIGYMCHSYKDPSRSWSVILAEETDSDEKGGGTGKGIFINAITKIANTVMVDGKNFIPEKSFQWQRANIDTKIIWVDDVKKNFDFPNLYTTITAGITIEKKNQDEILIPYKDSPKIILTTNYTIKSTSEHSIRRQRLLEFAPHYSSRHTPMDDFGRRLFDDWDGDEWTRFYNFMFTCVSRYLDKGLSDISSSPSIKRKQIRNDYGEEFLDWWVDFMENPPSEFSELTMQYNSFLGVNDLDKKDYSIKKWKSGLRAACTIFDFVYEERKDPTKSGRRIFKVKTIPS